VARRAAGWGTFARIVAKEAVGVAVDGAVRVASVGAARLCRQLVKRVVLQHGARTSIVAGGRNAGLAHASTVARLDAVAVIAVRARGTGRRRGVPDTLEGITRVGGARISIVDSGRSAVLAHAGTVADLVAVAGISVGA